MQLPGASVKKAILLTLILSSANLFAQFSFSEDSYDPLIDSLFKNENSFYQPYIDRQNTYQIQIIYTEINRDKDQNPAFTNHTWRLKPNEYFNPASFVKVPAAIFALEKINNIYSAYDVHSLSPLSFEKNTDCQEKEVHDSTCTCLYPNIAHYIKRALIVSENSPYKRLYEILGQEYIQNRLAFCGLEGSKIVQRFSSDCDEEGNRYTNAVCFFDLDSNVLYRQPPMYNEHYKHSPDSTIMVGNYIKQNRKLVKGGKDFSNANRFLLHHIHLIMMAIFFPDNMPVPLQFNLTPNDYRLLRTSLGINPSESKDPKYDPKDYWDTYNHYFFYGQSKKVTMMPHVRVFNKVAMAYGFLSETAYVADFKNKREFFLSSTMYVNKDNVILNGRYNYADLGMPFMQKLAYTIYYHELNRKLGNEPDLTELESLFQK